MNSTLKEKYMAAQAAKEKAINAQKEAYANDMNNWVWKNARNKKHIQEKIRLVDASEEQLQQFYNHCMSMLYNKDKDNPGRYTLLDIIEKQVLCCNTELFLHWLENTYEVDENRRPIKRSTFLLTINTFLQNNSDGLPKDRSQIKVSDVASGIPTEFLNIPLNYVINGCLDRLGSFSKKHMTLKFITNKLGLWFTPQEMNEFTEESKRMEKSRIELVKERCGIPSSVTINIKDDNILNFKEFRALVQLKTKNYSVMTVDQLLVLRDKGLFCLEEEVLRHIAQWNKIIDQIEQVAKYKGYTLQ